MCRCLTRPTSKSSHCPLPPRWSKPPRPFVIGDAWLVPRSNPCPPPGWPPLCPRGVWRVVVDGRLSIAFTRAFEEPDMWGLLLVDVARHASRAFAREGDYTEEEALTRIIDMFEAEIARPTDAGSTTPRSQQGH